MKHILTALFVVGAVGLSFAGTEKASVTKQQAIRTALNKFPKGIVLSTELEHEDGMFIWSMDVKVGKDIQEVWVDAKTGVIAKVVKESHAHERKERAQDKAAHKSH